MFDDVNWVVYDTSNAFIWSFDNFITALAVDSTNNIWTATQFDSCPIKFDWSSWTYIPSGGGSTILDIAVDKFNRKWIGYEGTGVLYPGLVILNNDTIERIFTLSNSPIPSAEIRSILFEDNDTSKVWMAASGGVVFFDGINWTLYSPANGFPVSSTEDIIIDHQGIKWVAAGVLIKWIDSGYVVYTTSNSILPEETAYKLAVDENDVVWVALSYGGLIRIEGENWNLFDMQNSPIPSDFVFSLAIDKHNNKWIATMGGLAIYHEGGVIWTGIPGLPQLADPGFSIYPNPFRNKGTLSFNCIGKNETFIGIYDIQGRLLHTIIRHTLLEGRYFFEIDLTDYSDGLYLLKCVSGDELYSYKLLKK